MVVTSEQIEGFVMEHSQEGGGGREHFLLLVAKLHGRAKSEAPQGDLGLEGWASNHVAMRVFPVRRKANGSKMSGCHDAGDQIVAESEDAICCACERLKHGCASFSGFR